MRVAGTETPAAPAVPFAVRGFHAHEGCGVGGRDAGRLSGGPASVVQSRTGRRSSIRVNTNCQSVSVLFRCGMGGLPSELRRGNVT